MPRIEVAWAEIVDLALKDIYRLIEDAGGNQRVLSGISRSRQGVTRLELQTVGKATVDLQHQRAIFRLH